MISQLLDQLANVYVETAATGTFSTQTITGLPCRVVSMSRLAHEQDERIELVGVRKLMFDATFSIPENCQLDFGDGIRWAPRPGTFFSYPDWTGTPAYKSCWIERQQVQAFTS